MNKSREFKQKQEAEGGVETGCIERQAATAGPAVDDCPDGPLGGKGGNEYQQVKGGGYPAR